MSHAAHRLTLAPLQTAASLIDLLDRTARQDRDAFADLYEATCLKLFGVVMRILKSKPLAEDILQDAYIKIWEKADDFDASRGSAITWMAVIARNRALDELRRRPNLISSEDMADFNEIAAPDTSILDQLLRTEDCRRLAQCLGGLDHERRSMILSAYYLGTSREDLASRFGHPVATIKTWLRRGLAALKDCLES